MYTHHPPLKAPVASREAPREEEVSAAMFSGEIIKHAMWGGGEL